MKTTLAFVSLVFAPWIAPAESSIDPDAKFAYGANVGWINLEGDRAHGVVVGEFFLSGSAYGANVGWIGFGDGSPANGFAYANASRSDYGVNNDGAGNLSGFAYGGNIGWINFGWAPATHPDRPRVDLITGNFAGFAYGANVGWINLGAASLATARLDCVDRDGDGIGDGWEALNFTDTTTATATSDTDGDGVSDRDEYVGGSDPNDPASFLRIVSQSASPAALPRHDVSIEFTSAPGRAYTIAVSPDLKSPFVDSGLGVFAGDPGPTTTRTLVVSGQSQFYRVIALKPLP